MVLPYIKMNPPQVYMCSSSWTLLPSPSPYHPSGSSQCTSPQASSIVHWTWTGDSFHIWYYTYFNAKLMSIELLMPSNHLILCPLFSSCLQSFPASGSFPMSWLFMSGGQSIRASTSAPVLPVDIQAWFPLGLNGLTSLLSKESQESSPATQFESINSSVLSLLYGPTHTHTLLPEKP